MSPHNRPRIHGRPRPVRLPSSESASAKPVNPAARAARFEARTNVGSPHLPGFFVREPSSFFFQAPPLFHRGVAIQLPSSQPVSALSQDQKARSAIRVFVSRSH